MLLAPAQRLCALTKRSGAYRGSGSYPTEASYSPHHGTPGMPIATSCCPRTAAQRHPAYRNTLLLEYGSPLTAEPCSRLLPNGVACPFRWVELARGTNGFPYLLPISAQGPHRWAGNLWRGMLRGTTPTRAAKQRSGLPDRLDADRARLRRGGRSLAGDRSRSLRGSDYGREF